MHEKEKNKTVYIHVNVKMEMEMEMERSREQMTQHCRREKETYTFCSEWEQWEDVRGAWLHNGEWMNHKKNPLLPLVKSTWLL